MTTSIQPTGLADVALPYAEQYFGIWAMHEEHFQALAHKLHGYDVRAHLIAVQTAQQAEPKAAAPGNVSSRPFALSPDGIAMIPIRGTLMKHQSSISSSTSTVVARRQVRAAQADEAVKAIFLHIESPGGTVAGTAELAADVAQAAKSKPVWSYIEDLGASAAYWIASQANKVIANRMALVGSIGTYGVVYDLSEAAAKDGIKVHVVRAGAYKGMFTPGSEVTAEQLASYQAIIDQMNEAFLQGVASGRRMGIEAVRGLADGRVHMAKNAQGIGLIDAVDTAESALGQLIISLASPSPIARKVASMSAATYQELKAGCPGADAEFICRQLDAGATLEQARTNWMTEQSQRLASRSSPGLQRIPNGKVSGLGVQPVHAGATSAAPSYAGDAIAEWNERLEAKMAKGMKIKQATSALVHEDPELHRAYLTEYNAQHGSR